MSSRILIPFNFQPVATAVKTASYTIPAGRYAKVSANVQTGGTFSISGVIALSSVSASWTALASSPVTTGNDGQGTAMKTMSGGTNTGAAFGSSTAVLQTSASESFWVPAGTVITGAGSWRATVQEYNNIT